MFDDVVVSYRSPVSLAGSSGSKASDAIESYRVGGVEYLVMANEGDTRDYTGFSEEVRIGAGGYVLDPAVFQDAATLKQQANLGRLTAPTRSAPKKAIPILSSRKSTCPARGLFRSVRQRAISSSTAATPLKRSLQRTPTLFNSDGTPATFDTRSDNKGPEPEAIVIGRVFRRPYAFIRLERAGGVYDISDPFAPFFVDYVNTGPEDIAPEG
jgi:uncharacterized protein